MKAVFDERWVPLLQDMWRHCAELWPDLAKEMLRQLDPSYRLAEGVGWARLTTYLNGCAPGHVDQGNYAITAVLAADVSAAWDLQGGKSDTLVGGGQVIMCGKLHNGVYVIEGPWGVMYAGPYTTVLHAACAVRQGARFMVSAYFPSNLLGKKPRPQDM